MRSKYSTLLATLPLLASCAGAAPTSGPAAFFVSPSKSVAPAHGFAGGARSIEADAHDEGDGDRKLARSVWLVFEIDDEGPARPAFNREAAAVVKRFGGYVASESQGSLTIRVPAKQLDETIAALGQIEEIVERGHRVDDVTRAHRDLSVRIDNAKKLQARLLLLLEKTQDVKTLVTVEKELSRVTTELETLEAEMRNLNRMVDLATITINFRDDVSPGPVGWLFYGMYRGVKWLFVWD